MGKGQVKRQVLYCSERLRAVYQPAESGLLVFSFNGGHYNGTGSEFFGSGFFAKHGIAAVGFVDQQSGWFPPDEMALAISALSAEVRRTPETKLVTYGISMGAWAALRYSRALGANTALAFGPQFSIDPSIIGHFEARYAGLFRPEIHTGMQILQENLCARNFVFFDPLASEDAAHAELIARLRGVHTVLGPFLGHAQLPYFTEMGLGRRLFALAEDPDSDASCFRSLVRSNRALSRRYHMARAERLLARPSAYRMRWVLQSYEHALRIALQHSDNGNMLRALIGLINALLHVGRRAEARSYIGEVMRLGAILPYTPPLRDVLLRLGAYAEARQLVSRAVAEQPTNSEFRIDLARILLAQSDFEQAKSEIDVAHDNVDRWPNTRQRIQSLYERIIESRKAAETDVLPETPAQAGLSRLIAAE